MKNIIFDFDGTLVDTAPLIVSTMQAAMREMRLPVKTDAECRSTIGMRLEEIPAVLWPDCGEIGVEYAHVYRRIFNDLKRPFNVQCFPGVKENLALLHDAGFGMAIASSRSRNSLAEYVDNLGIAGYFVMLIGGDDVNSGKPSPEPVHKILEAQKWNAENAVTVGDSHLDILMGKAAGTETCAVTYGNGSFSELQSVAPDHIIPDFRDLLPIVDFRR